MKTRFQNFYLLLLLVGLVVSCSSDGSDDGGSNNNNNQVTSIQISSNVSEIDDLSQRLRPHPISAPEYRP